jgi:predicted amidophosphoribosyltransferase
MDKKRTCQSCGREIAKPAEICWDCWAERADEVSLDPAYAPGSRFDADHRRAFE